jgi:hypothetical protein
MDITKVDRNPRRVNRSGLPDPEGTALDIGGILGIIWGVSYSDTKGDTPMLSDSIIRAARAREKTYKMSDGHGLYLAISPSGGKLWRWKYRFERREKVLSLGAYPVVGLKDARVKHFEARKLLANGIDPSAQRKAAKAARTGANTLVSVARE